MRMLMTVWLVLACRMPAPEVVLTPEVAAPAPAPVATPRAPAKPLGPVVCGLDPRTTGPHDAALEALGRRVGLDHPEAFASVATHLHDTGRLPDCYRTKREADRQGWQRGSAVWSTIPGGAIGGDTFGNREGLLPPPVGGGFVEADLDDDGGRRGAHRLVYDRATKGAWRMWVTVDHYDSFTAVEVE